MNAFVFSFLSSLFFYFLPFLWNLCTSITLSIQSSYTLLTSSNQLIIVWLFTFTLSLSPFLIRLFCFKCVNTKNNVDSFKFNSKSAHIVVWPHYHRPRPNNFTCRNTLYMYITWLTACMVSPQNLFLLSVISKTWPPRHHRIYKLLMWTSEK